MDGFKECLRRCSRSLAYLIDGMVMPTKRQKKNQKQSRDSKFSLGLGKFEASMEHPSEKPVG